MLEFIGLLLTLTVVIYAISRGMLRDLWHVYVPRSSGVSPAAPVEITSSRADVAAHTSTDTSTISDNARAPYPYLTERDIVVWLAGLKTADSWRYSANKIYAFVGGNRNDVMRWVRSVRGEEFDAQPAAITPIAGRPYDPRAYADDPALAYEEPPR